MTTISLPEIPVPDGQAPQYLWVLVPAGPAGMTATLPDAYQAKKRAMDQHRDADAAAVFEVHPADDWPYVRLTPDGGCTRATHEWMAANIARSRARETERRARKARTSGT